jgi:hypothetical protein
MILKGGARRLIADAKFDRSGSKCFSRDELKCQPGLSWRQAKVAPQTLNGPVHDEIRDDLAHCWCRSLVAVRLSGDLLLSAKHLFVAAMRSGC